MTTRRRWPARAGSPPSGPVLVDRFLEDAVEVDVDAVRDATGEVVIGGVMEHVEEAGVHSGDSACALPPQTLGARGASTTLERHTRGHRRRARGVRACSTCSSRSRTGRSTCSRPTRGPAGPCRSWPRRPGCPLAMVAARVMVGPDAGRAARRGACCRRRRSGPVLDVVSVKEAVLPFDRFPGVDTLLGPEMRSTGRGHGHRRHLRPGLRQEPDRRRDPPARRTGTVFLSLADRDKAGRARGGPRTSAALGFDMAATLGTAGYLRLRGYRGGHAGGQGGRREGVAPTPSS